MNDNGKALMGCLSIVIGILAGIIAWNKIQPHSFLSVLGFLIVWVIFTLAGRYLLVAVLGFLILLFRSRK